MSGAATTKPRSNSVNDTLSTASSSMASDLAKGSIETATESGDRGGGRNGSANFNLIKRNALRRASKNFFSHHNLAYGIDDDPSDEASREAKKEGGFY